MSVSESLDNAEELFCDEKTAAQTSLPKINSSPSPAKPCAAVKSRLLSCALRRAA